VVTTVPGFTSDYACFEAQTHLAESNAIRSKQGKAEQKPAKMGALAKPTTPTYYIDAECVGVK
jgi:hypothetical protein